MPVPSVVGLAGVDPQFARLVYEIVTVLILCSCKSKSRDVSVFKRILTLAEQTLSWICIMETNVMTIHHTILIETLYSCAHFIVEERKSFDDDLVYLFCIKMLKKCTESQLLDHFPLHQMLFTLKCTDARHHFMVINGLHIMPRDPTTLSKELRKCECIGIRCKCKLHLKGKARNVQTIEELLLALQNHDLLLYFVHGSGMQYIGAKSFGKLGSCAAAFLMGCCSGSLRKQGCYAPQGALLHYFFAGSLAIIANLLDVTDTGITLFAKAILNSWTQDSGLHPS